MGCRYGQSNNQTKCINVTRCTENNYKGNYASMTELSALNSNENRVEMNFFNVLLSMFRLKR